MPITTLSSRALNQDIGRIKKAARHGPMFITDRGKPVHVLLSIEARSDKGNRGILAHLTCAIILAQ